MSDSSMLYKYGRDSSPETVQKICELTELWVTSVVFQHIMKLQKKEYEGREKTKIAQTG